MASIVNLELLDDELKAVVQAGGYGSEKEAVGHALEVLLSANPHLRTSTAVELYRQEKVTLARAAEIAGHSKRNSQSMTCRSRQTNRPKRFTQGLT